jgi:hypothetical protein
LIWPGQLQEVDEGHEVLEGMLGVPGLRAADPGLEDAGDGSKKLFARSKQKGLFEFLSRSL